MEKEEELFIPKTKHKGLKIFIGIILLATLITGAYFLYQYKFNNSKTIVNKFLDLASSNINESFKETNDSYKINGLLKFSSNFDVEELKLLSDIAIQFDGEIDPKEKISNINIDSKYQNDKLIDANIYKEDKTYYVLLDDIYDKYIKLEESNEEDSISKINISKKNIKTMLDSIITSLKKELNELEFKKEETTITIDGKNVDVINNYVELKDKEVNEFAKKLLTNLKNDTKFMGALNEINGENSFETIDKILKGMDEEIFSGTYKICFYTDKGLLNKNIVSVRQTITVEGKETNIIVDKISDDEIMISVPYDVLNLTFKVKKNNSAINITASIKGEERTFDAELNINYEKIKDIKKVDVTNSKDVNSLTEKEVTEIESKIMENANVKKLMEAISKITNEEA